jgi:hypothetical protein
MFSLHFRAWRAARARTQEENHGRCRVSRSVAGLTIQQDAPGGSRLSAPKRVGHGEHVKLLFDLIVPHRPMCAGIDAAATAKPAFSAATRI